ncbi:MAG: transglycosylase SLT domain-containing protein [Pseudomonadota bacterium]
MQVFDPVCLTLSALALALLTSGAAAANEAKTAPDLPAMRWDHAAKAAEWTAQALAQVAEHDAELTDIIPADIEVYCPGYADATVEDRRAFWVAILSATAKYESGFRAKATGLHGRYVGLMQISLTTARHSGCEATTTASLKDGAANLSCAVDIIAPRVAADGMVAGKGNRGIARDWGPWAKAKTRASIAKWTRAQDYCQP